MRTTTGVHTVPNSINTWTTPSARQHHKNFWVHTCCTVSSKQPCRIFAFSWKHQPFLKIFSARNRPLGIGLSSVTCFFLRVPTCVDALARSIVQSTSSDQSKIQYPTLLPRTWPPTWFCRTLSVPRVLQGSRCNSNTPPHSSMPMTERDEWQIYLFDSPAWQLARFFPHSVLRDIRRP